jgi:hypothetical protein
MQGEIVGRLTAMANSNRSVEWPSALVGTALILVLGGIMVTGVAHYQSVDDALKLFGGLSALVGVVTGAFVSYFFTRGTIQQANQVAAQHAERADAEAGKANAAQSALTLAVAHLTPADFKKIQMEPAVRTALGNV